MFKSTLFVYVVLSIASGLLTLLSSVGIFISLIVQKRLDRLQDILEDFINLSYRSEVNLSGQMYNLIEKYQMHFIFPQRPRTMILRYIDFNVIFILTLWAGTSFLFYEPPFSLVLFPQLLPLAIGIYATLSFRRLLRHTINLENPLFDNITPPPAKLRSISYLSHFVSISVKSILKQARLTLHIRCHNGTREEGNLEVLLKEELSFDDYFYYLYIESEKRLCFLSFGEILFSFPPDKITNKPVPAWRNINIPLGSFHVKEQPSELNAQLLVFTEGEKHPIQYIFRLVRGPNFMSCPDNPDITVNHQIVYTVENKIINVLQDDANIPFLSDLSPHFKLDGKHYYINNFQKFGNQMSPIKPCPQKFFID